MLTTNSLGCPLSTTSGHRTLSVYIHLKPVMQESNIGKNVSQHDTNLIFFPLAVIWRLPVLLLKTLPVLFPTIPKTLRVIITVNSSLVPCPAFDYFKCFKCYWLSVVTTWTGKCFLYGHNLSIPNCVGWGCQQKPSTIVLQYYGSSWQWVSKEQGFSLTHASKCFDKQNLKTTFKHLKTTCGLGAL